MKARTRNLLVWSCVLAIVAAIGFFAARARLQFTDPALFLLVMAAAAAALSVLLWWEIAADDPDGGESPRQPIKGEGT